MTPLILDNYTLFPTGRVERIERVSSSVVELFFATDPPLAALGTTYSLTAANITGFTERMMTTGPGATLSFVLTATTLDEVFVYPHPVSIGRDREVTFANLTQQATVEVLDQRFNVVATIDEIDGNGGAVWNLQDSRGQTVPPGLYFYRVNGVNSQGASGESGLRKLMLRR